MRFDSKHDMYKNVMIIAMKTINNRTPKASRPGRFALLRAIWTVILAVMLFALPAESALITIDPGAFPDYSDLTNSHPCVTLIAEIPDTPPGDFVTNISPPGEPSVFLIRYYGGGGSSKWTDIDFVKNLSVRILPGTPPPFRSICGMDMKILHPM